MLMGLCVFHITNECNLKCKHCYASAGNKLNNEFTLEEIKGIIDQLEELSVNYITLSGGEPFLRADIFEILEYLKLKKFNVMITSNGTLLNDEVLAKVKKLGVDSIQISLDSHIKEVNDDFRGVSGAYEMAINGVKKCIEHGVKVSIMSTLSAVNSKYIKDILDFAVGLGVNGIAMERFVPEGRGTETREIAVKPEELKNCLELLYEYQQKYPKCVFTTNDPLFIFVDEKYKYVHEMIKDNPDLCGGCSVGRMAFIITPDAEVALCTRLYTKIGSIREKKIKDILENNELIHTVCNRSNLKGKCGICKYKNICGGCRGWAYQTTGDYLGEDNLCWLKEEEII